MTACFTTRPATAPRPAHECVAIERLRVLLRLDAKTGQLFWRESKGRARAGDEAGTKRPRGEISVRIDGVIYLAHHVVWALRHGAWSDSEIDHRDGDPGNNRPRNLRQASRNGNVQNVRKARSTNRDSRLLGAYRSRGNRWYSAIGVNGRVKYLGSFPTAKAAHTAYVAAKRELHPTCTI